jgi:hypothetical protein
MDLETPNFEDFTKAGAGDEKLFVVFYMGIVKDEGKSIDAGRPIYADTEMIRIFCPGDKNNVIDRPMRPTDKARFPKQYAAFKAGADEDGQQEGTPLREWPNVSRSQVAELAWFGIRTVEQLADVRDDVCLKVHGLTSLKQVAGVWLQKAKSTAEAAKIAKQLDDMKTANDELRGNVRDLMATNQALQDQLRAIVEQRAMAAA